MEKSYLYTPKILDSGSYHVDLSANHDEYQETPGSPWAIMTPFGPAKVRYGKCIDGAAKGEVFAYRANQTITDFTSGSTTTAVKSGFTADEYKHDLLMITDVNASAGAAPEGEVAPIVKNTATTIYLDPANPFSAAVAVSDDGSVVSFCKCVDAGDNEEVNNLFGVAATAITANHWGWFFCDGICPYVKVTTDAITAGHALITDASEALKVSSTSSDETLVGTVLGKLAIAADNVPLACVCKLWNWGQGRGVSA